MSEDVSMYMVTDASRVLRSVAEQIGYGRSMQIVSDLWRQKDPAGAISTGECFATLEAARKKGVCVTCGKKTAKRGKR